MSYDIFEIPRVKMTPVGAQLIAPNLPIAPNQREIIDQLGTSNRRIELNQSTPKKQ